MFVIMGGTGNVGSATASVLLDRGEPVTILTRRPERAGAWRDRGAVVRHADVGDPASLREAFRTGRRALLLNPPADVSGDTDAEERRTIDAILEALDGSGLEKVVAVSTYGVRPGNRIGDLGTLWWLEEGLRRQTVPAAIDRHAYSMTNWTGLVDVARETGSLPTMLPADLVLPMVAPADLGRAAADRLQSGLDDVGVVFVEGPARYTPADVAAAFSTALGREVRLDAQVPDDLEAAFVDLGFSCEAAESYAGMTRLTLQGADLPENPWRGEVTLADFFAGVAAPT